MDTAQSDSQVAATHDGTDGCCCENCLRMRGETPAAEPVEYLQSTSTGPISVGAVVTPVDSCMIAWADRFRE